MSTLEKIYEQCRVTYEQALKLKSLNFNDYTDHFYEKGKIGLFKGRIGSYSYAKNTQMINERVCAPTYIQVKYWLSEFHNINLTMIPVYPPLTMFPAAMIIGVSGIIKTKESVISFEISGKNIPMSPEEARNELIDQALNYITFDPLFIRSK